MQNVLQTFPQVLGDKAPQVVGDKVSQVLGFNVAQVLGCNVGARLWDLLWEPSCLPYPSFGMQRVCTVVGPRVGALVITFFTFDLVRRIGAPLWEPSLGWGPGLLCGTSSHDVSTSPTPFGAPLWEPSLVGGVEGALSIV